MCKYPEVKIELVGQDGNAFSILGRCQGIARRAGLDKSQIDEFMTEATSGDYDHLLCTCMEYFDCDGTGEDEWQKII